LRAAELGRGLGVVHHSRANRSGITSQGQTGMGVSYLAAARTLRVVTFRVPALGIRGRANSRTPSGDPGLRWGDEAVPKGTSDRRSDVAEEPARQCWLWASFALSSHLSNAPTPPSRSHMFIRSASLPNISRFRAARRFHRSATPIRFCKIAIHPTIKLSRLNDGSPRSSSTTRSAKPSTRAIFANRGAVSRTSAFGGVFQSFMRPAYAHPRWGWIHLPIFLQAPGNAQLSPDPKCGCISLAAKPPLESLPFSLGRRWRAASDEGKW